jgi:DNA polymerase I
MLPRLDVRYGVLRGRYMKAAASIEHRGTPIDTEKLDVLRAHWGDVQEELIARIDADYGVYDGRSFQMERFARFLMLNNIPWPTHPTGALKLDDDTFRDMARAYPIINQLRELRVSLSKMRLLQDLAVGSDGRNRCLLSAYRSKTGRNQPSNAKFIFGPAVWVRGLIRPEPGCGLAYLDWSQQEFGIAAALSGDTAMCDAYISGDPYLAFAKQAGAVPPDGTKESHGTKRDQFKACVLAVQYGMGEESLARRIGRTPVEARELLTLHRRTYPIFWCWSDDAVNHAMLNGWLGTVFGWRVHVGVNVNARSLCNFPMQANGAEMLRLGCGLATERGIRVCAPVHDAILIEAPLAELDDAVHQAQATMAEASRIVLGGFELRSDAKVIRYPDRFEDDRGQKMWNVVWEVLG